MAFACIVLAAFLFFSFPAESRAQKPFGGQIGSITKCIEGLLLKLGPPSAGNYMYGYGISFSYAYGPPRRKGQWLLGLSGGYLTCTVPCKKKGGKCVKGGGPLIIYHGSSM